MQVIYKPKMLWCCYTNALAWLIMLALSAPLFITSIQAACPANTLRINGSGGSSPGWCLRLINTSMTFCDALTTCRSLGESIVGREVLEAMKAVAGSLAYSQYLWLGLTDALRERNTSKDGWVWIADGRVTTAAEGALLFQSSEPNDLYNQDCATTYSSTELRVRDAKCTDPTIFYCYSAESTSGDPHTNPALSPESQGRGFARAEIVDFSQPDPGCWINRALQSNGGVLDCAVACFTYGSFGNCVGFYWNPVRKECILLPHFDATVPLGFHSAWEKSLWRKFSNYQQSG